MAKTDGTFKLHDPEADYPLWCVVWHPDDERGYCGPFDTKEMAEKRAAKLAAEEERDEPFPVTRCRRVDSASIVRGLYDLSYLVEQWDEQVSEGGGPTEAWGNWDDQLVGLRAGAEEAFKAFVREYVVVALCENMPEDYGR